MEKESELKDSDYIEYYNEIEAEKDIDNDLINNEKEEE